MKNLSNIEATSTEFAEEVNHATTSDASVSTVKVHKEAKFKLANPQTAKTDAEIAESKEQRLDQYRPLISLEKSMPDDSESIVKHLRDHYESEYNNRLKATALSTLKMCRTVYEAKIALDEYEFKKFCTAIEQSDTSSTIRKKIAIGRAYPRLVQYADQLSSGWTAIYQVTQIPADTFDQMIANKEPLNTLRGKKLSDLIANAKPVERLTDEMSFNKKTKTHSLAQVHAMCDLDVLDVRAIEIAFNELQTRLPIRFVFTPDLMQATKKIRMQIYETAKKNIVKEERYTPETWDLGALANSVLPSTEVQDVTPKN
jgi:hypothetical protein